MRIALSLIDNTLNTMRQMILELRPMVLDHLGLEAAIEWQVEEFQKRMGYPCKLDLNAREIGIDNERDVAIFRILQEALTNVARHAHADHVEVSLHKSNSLLVMTIKDNGIGIEDQKKRSTSSLGLISMNERAGVFRGNVYVEAMAGGGTQVICSIPLRRIV
jgi:signal transduction histidine kinase